MNYIIYYVESETFDKDKVQKGESTKNQALAQNIANGMIFDGTKKHAIQVTVEIDKKTSVMNLRKKNFGVWKKWLNDNFGKGGWKKK